MDLPYRHQEFSDQNLQDMGFLHTEAAENDHYELTYPIHPIFQRKQWHHCDDTSWADLDPVLRLASALLESPASLSFICSIVSSHREILQEEYECLKLLATRIRQIDKPKAEIRQIATSVLQKMTQVTQFRWSTPKGPNKFCIDGQTWRNGHEKVCVHPNTSGFKSTICINKYIFQAVAKAAKPINKAPWNVCLKLRWQFLSASTFCHEVIHAIQQAVRVSLIMVEPFWEDDRIAELGQAWECVVYGGKPCPSDDLSSGAFLIVEADKYSRNQVSPASLTRRGPADSQTYYFIPMAFIAGIQKQEFWDTLNGDANRLRVPRSAGYTYYIRGEDLDIEIFTKLPVPLMAANSTSSSA